MKEYDFHWRTYKELIRRCEFYNSDGIRIRMIEGEYNKYKKTINVYFNEQPTQIIIRDNEDNITPIEI